MGLCPLQGPNGAGEEGLREGGEGWILQLGLEKTLSRVKLHQLRGQNPSIPAPTLSVFLSPRVSSEVMVLRGGVEVACVCVSWSLAWEGE